MTGQSASGLFARLCFRVLSLVCVCLSFSIPAGPVSEVRELVVAIGDVHGDFDDFSLILKRVGLIGEGNHWSGGHATLVQTGDLVDRGPKEREVLELMISLEKEAPGDGGRVVALLGNHEMMNFMADLRYVTPEIYASFATADSDQLRKSAYQEYLQWQKGNSRILAKTHDPLLELSAGQTGSIGRIGHYDLSRRSAHHVIPVHICRPQMLVLSGAVRRGEPGG